MSTTPKDGTTKKRKGVKARRWLNLMSSTNYGMVFPTRKEANLNRTPYSIVVRATTHLPATGIIKKARK